MRLPAFEDPRSQFDVRFYLVAICSSSSISSGIPVPLGGVARLDRRRRLGSDDDLPRELTLGFVYAWKKGALEWE
jgi:NADH-quinone oxidoreductase subunit A